MSLVCSDTFWNTNALGCGSSNTNPNVGAASTDVDFSSNTVQFCLGSTANFSIVIGTGGRWEIPANQPLQIGGVPTGGGVITSGNFIIHPKTPRATVVDLSDLSRFHRQTTGPAATGSPPHLLGLPRNIQPLLRFTILNQSMYPTYFLVDSDVHKTGATIHGVSKSVGVRGGEGMTILFNPYSNMWHIAGNDGLILPQ